MTEGGVGRGGAIVVESTELDVTAIVLSSVMTFNFSVVAFGAIVEVALRFSQAVGNGGSKGGAGGMRVVNPPTYRTITVVGATLPGVYL